MTPLICIIIYIIGVAITAGIIKANYIAEHNWQQNVTFCDVFYKDDIGIAIVLIWPIALILIIVALILSIISIPTSWIVVKILKKIEK